VKNNQLFLYLFLIMSAANANAYEVTIYTEEYPPFGQWREKYKQMQGEVDALITGDIREVKGWRSDPAQKLIQSVTKIPTGSLLGSAADYAMFSYDTQDFIIKRKNAKSLNQNIPKSYLNIAHRVIDPIVA
jgi:hypothetical protein